VEIKHASDRKFYLELKKELIAKTIDQETFDQLKPVASIFYLLATCIFHRDIFSAPFTNMLNFYPTNAWDSFISLVSYITIVMFIYFI
jgi:hypothetical protein